MYVCLYIYIYMYVCLYIYICMYVCVYIMYVCIYVCMYVCLCVCVHVLQDIKTIDHMKYQNLKRYQITSVDDAYAVIEDNGDTLTMESSRDRGTASLERGLALSTRGAQAINLSQKGKKDTMVFTLQVNAISRTLVP